MIETGGSRHDGHTQARQLQHVFQVERGKRRFPGYQDQLAPLLDGHIGGPFDQVIAGPAGNGGEGPGGARAHHHGGRRTTAGSNRCGPLFQPADHQVATVCLHPVAQGLLCRAGAGRQFQLGFHADHHPRRLGQDDEDLAIRIQQTLQQAQSVGGTGSAGEGQCDSFFHTPIPTPRAINAARMGINTTRWSSATSTPRRLRCRASSISGT